MNADFVYHGDNMSAYAKKGYGRDSKPKFSRRDSDDKFDRRPRRDSEGDFGGSRFKRSPVELFDAVCGKCGKTCQVPFKPTGEKPVYCRDCFVKTDTTGPRFSSNQPTELDRINEKLDKIMRALKIQ
jgi:CxxC-x17-CxxC domain-containing protein